MSNHNVEIGKSIQALSKALSDLIATGVRPLTERIEAVERNTASHEQDIGGLDRRMLALDNDVEDMDLGRRALNERLAVVERQVLPAGTGYLSDRVAEVEKGIGLLQEIHPYHLEKRCLSNRLSALEARQQDEVTDPPILHEEHETHVVCCCGDHLIQRGKREEATEGALPGPGQSGPFGNRSDLVSEATRDYIRRETAREIAGHLRTTASTSRHDVAQKALTAEARRIELKYRTGEVRRVTKLDARMLRFYPRDTWSRGDRRHPQAIIRLSFPDAFDLTPHLVGDCWHFKVPSVPDSLPPGFYVCNNIDLSNPACGCPPLVEQFA